MPGLDWLTARPVAHRGLHDSSRHIVENTPTAFVEAIAGNYAIECDLRISADGEAFVFHDRTLERLTEVNGPVSAQTSDVLSQVSFRQTKDRMLTLTGLCNLVAGRVPLFLELKSEFDGDSRLPARVAQVLTHYSGPVAAMSFDPVQVRALAAHAPGLPRGLVAQRPAKKPEHDTPSGARLTYMLNAVRARPHFVAYCVDDLPAAAPLIARWLFGMPLLAWTVRTPQQRARAARWADQMIFEGFRP
jgi:glycerophosphoryl diester phosphodiesterase